MGFVIVRGGGVVGVFGKSGVDDPCRFQEVPGLTADSVCSRACLDQTCCVDVRRSRGGLGEDASSEYLLDSSSISRLPVNRSAVSQAHV